MLYALTCGPLILILASWIKLYWPPRNQKGHTWGLVALAICSANAVLASATFLYYQIRPLASGVPPWQNPEILQLGLLFLSAPIAMIVGVVALARGAPKWLIAIVQISSLPLLLVGIMAGVAD